MLVVGILEDEPYRLECSATIWSSLGLLEFPLDSLPFAYSFPSLLTMAFLPKPLQSTYTRATLRTAPVARAVFWPLSSPRLGDFPVSEVPRSRSMSVLMGDNPGNLLATGVEDTGHTLFYGRQHYLCRENELVPLPQRRFGRT